MLVNANTAECNVFQYKNKLSRTYPQWRYRHERNYLGYRYRHEKPDCMPSFLNTSEESRKFLIFSTQCHRVLISSRLSPSEKVCDTNPSREQKNAAVFAKRINWRKITFSTHRSHRSEQNKCTSKKKKIVTSNSITNLCMQARNILTHLSPNPAWNPTRPEKPGPTYNSGGRNALERRAHTFFTFCFKMSFRLFWNGYFFGSVPTPFLLALHSWL